MAHLLNVWSSVSSRLQAADRVLLLFDYDGTLTPIVPRPEDALLSGEVSRLLRELVAQPRFAVGIVSGRSLEDLIGLSGIPGLILAGNHGMEIQGQGLQFVHPGAVAARGILDQADRDLRVELSQIPGALVEHKGLTLTVHYRSVDDSLLGEVDSVIDRLTRGFVESGQLR